MSENQENVNTNINNLSSQPQNNEFGKEIQKSVENLPDNMPENPNFVKSEENQENWKKFREEKIKERKAREEAERLAKQKMQEAEALKKAMEALIETQKTPQQNNSDFNNILYDEDEEKRIQRLIDDRLNQERKKYQEDLARAEAQKLPQLIQQNMPDFNQVCTQENVDYLYYKNPSLAKSLEMVPNSYNKWAAVYEAVKGLVPLQAKNDSNIMQRNLAKPQSAAAVLTDTKPETQGWQLSEQRKKENQLRAKRESRQIG